MLTCVALFAFALVATRRVFALSVWPTYVCSALVNVNTGHLRISGVIWRTLAEVTSGRVDTLRAGTANGLTVCRRTAFVDIQTGHQR